LAISKNKIYKFDEDGIDLSLYDSLKAIEESSLSFSDQANKIDLK
jgi:hypothetical protein